MASAGSVVNQAARDLTVQAPPVVPAMESVPAVAGASRIETTTGVFVGRSAELARLDSAVSGAGGRAVVVAVHGLGGVGKSTLAARFAESRGDRFSFVWWVTADSSAAIATGLADLAVAIAPEAAVLPAEQRVELGVRWLATHDGWLLVLDNLTTPSDAAGLLERVRTGTVVITSRQGTGWGGIPTVAVDVLTAEQAVDLLDRLVRAEWPDADLSGAEALCAELGFLPLAVEQAAAYLVQDRIDPTAYLDLLGRFPARVFTAAREGGDARRTMARVWHVTLDRLADTPLAGDLLRVVAWWAPNGIPRDFLSGLGEEPDVHEASRRLAAYSMITLTRTEVSVHRLVQAVTRTEDPADPHRRPEDVAAARDTAATILSDCVTDLDPRSPADWPRYHQVLPHARALFGHTTPDTDTPHTAHLLAQLGHYLDNRGDPAAAVTHHARAAQSFERLYGPDHPETLTCRGNLAGAYRATGDPGRGIPLLEANAADRERVLGPDHPSTLTARNNLAYAYEAAGDLRRAIPLLEAVLADGVRVLGADHVDVLPVRGNLGNAYRAAGDPGRAVPLYEANLAAAERALGPDHMVTLTSRNNLALAYEALGDLDRAIPLHEAVLADRERLLGPDHPDTLTSRNNLAFAHHVAGDSDRAIRLLGAVLADRERVLGPDHPHALDTRNNLACVYQLTGDLQRAIPLHEEVLAARERVQGPDHPHTSAARDNLAHAYQLGGAPGRAIRLHKTILADRERALGPDHPDTLTTRHNLAVAHLATGDPDRAVPMLKAVVADRERVLGPDHFDTLASRTSLANALRDTGGGRQVWIGQRRTR
ncbi:tetratricopeptide repeat protein [Saccharothrix variisporea]|uniref:Tetratricopeptide repeat protein n=1 Tax=Saccharothrix variisporea TaxID=543527 RepID=A0A495XLF3_9PSEU|nr:tetratricopeptide repeat protein [Saccharothrix variisporea]